MLTRQLLYHLTIGANLCYLFGLRHWTRTSTFCTPNAVDYLLSQSEVLVAGRGNAPRSDRLMRPTGSLDLPAIVLVDRWRIELQPPPCKGGVLPLSLAALLAVPGGNDPPL